MTKILITGSSGFAGQNLINYLSKEKFFVETYSLRNIREPLLVKETDAIVHLAGKAHDLKNVSLPEEYYKVNFEITKKLYDAFLQSKAKKFIFISTVKAVADYVNETLTEEYKPNPKTHYGKSKLMAEEYIQSQVLPADKSYYILRPCMIHGNGNKGNLNLLYKFVSKGLPYPLASFKNRRSFLSVENLCFIIQELIERNDIPSGIYNIADDGNLSTNEVVSLLSEAVNKSPRLLHVPAKLISFIARIGDFFKLPLNTERLGKLTENYVVSNQKIKQALKKELPLSAHEGILKTAHSFKK
jgi:nucleoside-diphosphate-sugar epimerase